MAASNSLARVFDFNGNPIRTAVIAGDPWFVAADICGVLELSNRHSSLALLDDDEKGVHSMDTPGGPQELAVVNEPGMYSLVLRSRKPEAKKFKRWITHEVIPSIRKTGTYSVATSRPELSNRDLALMVIAEADRAEAAEAKVAELAPMAAQAEHHRAADGLTAVGDFANSLKAWAKREHNVRVLHDHVWAFLADIGLLIRGNTKRHNQPTAFATERDFVRAKYTEFQHNSGEWETSCTPRLTPAGEGWAWDRAVKRIAEHGSLAKPAPKSIEGAHV